MRHKKDRSSFDSDGSIVFNVDDILAIMHLATTQSLMNVLSQLRGPMVNLTSNEKVDES